MYHKNLHVSIPFENQGLARGNFYISILHHHHHNSSSGPQSNKNNLATFFISDIKTSETHPDCLKQKLHGAALEIWKRYTSCALIKQVPCLFI